MSSESVHVKVEAIVRIMVNGIPYEWDKETALLIAKEIGKAFPSVVITQLSYGTGGAGGENVPGGVGGVKTYIPCGVGGAGGQADQVCAAENKKFKERTVKTPAYKDPQSYVNTDVAS